MTGFACAGRSVASGISRSCKGVGHFWAIVSPRMILAGYGTLLLLATAAIAASTLSRSDFLKTPAAEAFREGRYAVATEAFEQLLEQYPDDPNILLNLANSLRRQGKLREAERVLLKARAIAPNAPLVYYYLGLIYYKTGDVAPAIEAYEKTVALAPESFEGQVARQALTDIARTKSQAQPVNIDRPWNAFAQLGTEYDDNVRAESGRAKDGAFRLTQYVEGSYRLVREGAFQVTAGGWAYHGANLDNNVDSFDLTAISPSLTASYATRIGGINALPSIGYSYEADWLGDDDYYGDRHEIRPELVLDFGPQWRTSIYYAAEFEKFDEKGFNPSISSRNAFTNVQGFQQLYFFDNRQSYVSLAVEFRQSDAHGSNFNADVYGGEVGVSLLLPYEIRLGLTGRYEYEDHPDFQAPDDLNIHRQIYSVSLMRNITENISASLYYSYRNDDATIGVFNYDRHVGGVYFGYTF